MISFRCLKMNVKITDAQIRARAAMILLDLI